MTGTQLVYDPTAQTQNEARRLGRKLAGLEGSVVGFIDNAKPNFEYLAEEIGRVLTGRYGVARVLTRRKRGAAMPAPVEYVDELVAECDLVITGSGD